MEYLLPTLIILTIVVFAALMLLRVKNDPHQTRGTEPGDGYTVINSDYQSGVSGQQSREYLIPRDPQEYAKQFVPKGKSK